MSRSTARHSRTTVAVLGVSSVVAVAALGPAATAAMTQFSTDAMVQPAAEAGTAYTDRFMTMYDKMHDSANGYFSDQGIPYHSVETLIVEAPDYGHETTSEAYSYWIQLEAAYGYVTGDWAPLNSAWATMEKYMIPQTADQPTNSFYNASSPATYASEYNSPSSYPSKLDSTVKVGTDPIAAELKSAYGTSDIYGMHWLADVDNVYGFGAAPGTGCELGPTSVGTSYINTFQRGPQESVWETVPQPACEEFKYGGTNGFLDLFTGDSSYAKQWKYTDAPDADARAVQAIYWANQWATEQGNASAVSGLVGKASKMGDYLRYAMFDKYFKSIGCTSPSCAAGSGKSSAHYLLSWYYAWGGANDSNAGWAWRIGSSHAHFGYQNPMAAWALSTDSALKPKGATAVADWSTSLDRQLEFYQWLQSKEGGIAGGATNSWDGAYATPPSGTPTFYGMAYTVAPVYNDPPSNQWFGMQVWGMERVAELYYASGNADAKALLDKWVPWATANTTFSGANWKLPSNLAWSGAPDTWNAASPGSNASLHVTVSSYGQDVGVAGSLARTLMHYAARSGDTTAQSNAQALLDAIWANNQDTAGVSTKETREDFGRFDDVMTSTTGNGLYIPSGWTGTMPNGDVIKPGVSFLDIRSWYKNDPDWSKVQTYLNGGAAPTFNYHRFWAQSEIALAMVDYDRLFNNGTPLPAQGTPTATPTTTPTTTPGTGGACTAALSLVNTWSGGFQASVTVTAGSAAITSWKTAFTLPAGVTISSLWSGVSTVSGTSVTVTNASSNGSLGGGQSTSYGFVGSGTAPSSTTAVSCTTG